MTDESGSEREGMPRRARFALLSAVTVSVVVLSLHVLTVGASLWVGVCAALLAFASYAHYRAAISGHAALSARLRLLDRQHNATSDKEHERSGVAADRSALPSAWTQLLWELPAATAALGAMAITLVLAG
ncbi:MAG TPA: hypothetical protein H9830_02690 [Candidatus Agrococcus pullicola]|uniref:Uncharacterized protein n=1 Tax=Candidatus Agrococcus pullicola TaxID=2838429 RepID=A0A9D1YSY8_9MICO|nr:hypothetical protein [Candidatus Agrococcus pullicola]